MNRRPILLTASLLASGLLLAGCTAVAATGAAGTASGTDGVEQPVTLTAAYDLSPSAVLGENADYTTVGTDEWSEAEAIDVMLSGSGLSGSAEGVSASGGVVTIAEAGVYRLSGALAGQLRIEAPDDALVVLILDGVDVSNDSGAAIEVVSADDVALHLASGSTNSVSDAASYADGAEANAAIYADTDLTISGDGSLDVTGNGNDGIASTDDLVILGGSVSVTAADDALRGKDALVVEGGSLVLEAGGDGMKSDGDEGDASADIDWTKGYIRIGGGSVSVTAGDDGLQAFTDIAIDGGDTIVSAVDDGVKGEVIVAIGPADDSGDDATGPTVTVTSSTEGIEAANIGISGGVVEVTASDDGINASGNAELQALIAGTEYVAGDREADTGERLEITGGTVTVRAAFDGLDSNGSVTISGGTVDITSAANGGDGPIDGNGSVEVAEGIVTANGSAYDPATAGGMGGRGGAGGPGGMPGAGGAPGEMPDGGAGGGAPPQDGRSAQG